MLRRRTTPPVAGRYVLLEPVGRGGSGTVWTAWDRRSRRRVAAKVLAPGADPGRLLRFVREQGVRVDHPHVLAPVGWAAEDDAVVIVMDLVRGGSLRDLLSAHGPLPAPAVAFLLGPLLGALAAVHEAGVVHGDVKPANLLLADRGGGRPHLLLSDFGVAATSADGVRFVGRGPVGTLGFLAPEQRDGAAPHPSQDVYAAGVVARRAMADAGPLLTLCDSMSRTDPRLRPTPAAALRRLRELPVRPAWDDRLPWPR